MVPPPRFDLARFETYLPDPLQPSQAAAVVDLSAFAQTLQLGSKRSWWRRESTRTERAGRYLDGGYGVGKTHLLAAVWHVAPEPKAYCTFVELTHVVGALGFAQTVTAFQRHRLLAIDEFELDDVGDTVLISSLLARLVSGGVRLVVTSNTLPERLGEGRFAAQDFRREIQGLAQHFETVRIDGDDYRHRGMPSAPDPCDAAGLMAAVRATAGASLDDFSSLCAHLATLHPVRYGDLLAGVRRVFLSDVHAVADQATALRLVVLVDRLYDREIPVTSSGVALDQVFPASMLAGGYRKKYLRAISRLSALARES